ncbi:hypothetical protein, partial [Lentibacillus salicampi]|uniref:hypothetical protein n=1 Tax=Lentibacillus salicampi TaxID=175306 RepID=UPI001ADD94A6
AVKPFLKSPVREICTPGSVGVEATNWVALLPGGKAGDNFKGLPIADFNVRNTSPNSGYVI